MRENKQSPTGVTDLGGCRWVSRPEKSPQKREAFKLYLRAIDGKGAGEAEMRVVWKEGF